MHIHDSSGIQGFRVLGLGFAYDARASHIQTRVLHVCTMHACMHAHICGFVCKFVCSRGTRAPSHPSGRCAPSHPCGTRAPSHPCGMRAPTPAAPAPPVEPQHQRVLFRLWPAARCVDVEQGATSLLIYRDVPADAGRQAGRVGSWREGGDAGCAP